EYFLSADNEYPVYFKPSKKELAELFGQEKSSDIKDFIKQNKIKLTQKEDLMKLVEYLNSDV
ncbi:MAG: hypothetical protein KJN70_01775, partial [Eudoraea sp.]|nr:hypothetical protein [Eudoraea sp.]